jgi:uncharacterized protein (TIGR00255 family)
MLYSMTGYGKASLLIEGRNIMVEMRSLNSKGMEINMKVPSNYRQFEFAWRNTITATLERGKVDVVVAVEETQNDISNIINKDLLKSYLVQLHQLCDETNASKEGLIDTVMKLPGVIQSNNDTASESVETQIESTLALALKEMQTFRSDEGNKLEEELLKRVEAIKLHLNQVKEVEPTRTKEIKEQLKTNLSLVIANENIDANRLEQEIIYYIEKLDITEEMVRLETHCNYFVEICNDAVTAKGRKLGFVAQELGREINTIGSKANNKDLQVLVVQMKDELEKIKEQLNNVL